MVTNLQWADSLCESGQLETFILNSGVEKILMDFGKVKVHEQDFFFAPP